MPFIEQCVSAGPETSPPAEEHEAAEPGTRDVWAPHIVVVLADDPVPGAWLLLLLQAAASAIAVPAASELAK